MEKNIVLKTGQDLQIIDYDDNKHLESNAESTEITVGENARLEIYRLQNLDDDTSVKRSIHIKQLRNSYVRIVLISFNGGSIQNDIKIDVDGEGSDTSVYGLYLVDKKQHVDNQLKVNHNVPNCTSDTKFKGIIDDEATAVFKGHIYVAPNAQKTSAYQNNSNIMLTDKAKINTQPFLEIYADDVKCSHGTSTGQLDPEAMFYMRQRGISKKNARMLLMYAFAAEISNHIDVEALHDRIDDMIKRRLKGEELSNCDTCIFQCSTPKEYDFNIDKSKI